MERLKICNVTNKVIKAYCKLKLHVLFIPYVNCLINESNSFV